MNKIAKLTLSVVFAALPMLAQAWGNMDPPISREPFINFKALLSNSAMSLVVFDTGQGEWRGDFEKLAVTGRLSELPLVFRVAGVGAAVELYQREDWAQGPRWALMDWNSKVHSSGDAIPDLLNAAGIVTVYNGFGTGFRTWGNRSAAFPANADPDNFISVHRTATIIEDSISAFSLNYIDKPITSGLISQLLLDVNAYLNSLVGLGASRDGAKAWFDLAKNPPQLLADGKLRICFKFLPPAPLETLIYESYIDVSLAAAA